MGEITKAAWADVKQGGVFLCIQTCSGYRLTTTDPQGRQHFLPVNVSDYELGEAVLDALAGSRFVPPQEQQELDADLFDLDLMRQRYAMWVKTTMEMYGYKSHAELFDGMKSCDIETRDNILTVRPSRHEDLEAWSGDGIGEDKYVIISANCDPDKIGAAVKVALSRCT